MRQGGLPIGVCGTGAQTERGAQVNQNPTAYLSSYGGDRHDKLWLFSSTRGRGGIVSRNHECPLNKE